MTPEEKALRAFVAARNEVDADFRERSLRECWAEDGSFEAPDGSANDRHTLSRLIGTQLRDRYHWVALKGRMERAPDNLKAKWRVKGSDGQVAEHDVIAVTDAEGRLTHVEASEREIEPRLARKLLSVAAENPVPALGVATAALYVVLRVPLGLFYNDLGVTPEEVGYTTEYLLRQSVIMLVAFVAITACLVPLFGLLIRPLLRVSAVSARLDEIGRRRDHWKVMMVAFGPMAAFSLLSLSLVYLSTGHLWLDAVLLMALLVASYAVGPWLALKLRAARRVRQVVDDRTCRSNGATSNTDIRVSGIVGGLIGVLLFTLPLWAIADAGLIRTGGSAGGRLIPWRAVPAKLRLGEGAPQVRLNNDCEHLRFLGEADRRVVVFDTRLDKAFRIPGEQVAVSLQRDC